ncbi:phospholipid phosphatase 5-like isoform X2 [Stegodyphus dumicola]|nr:phospholipid phosphatase 5-like isoform X2 [Stegodyphus dumicola]XP_035205084.1 phospholipid phosphatase 5-like isoform X2 [Stegodyphus dumicola]XP_035205085.1 phospholipid phosphatase 5-like isoform X2 [Stegodyphus dumicola]XP_035205087.1 phospholipid phosphatase 5-like isoform X2 [Stegodyphus dumicola]
MNDSRSHQYILAEFLLRFVLGVIFLILEYAEPFRRKIHPDELWLYKNPRTESYIPTRILWVIICIIPFLITFLTNLLNKSKADGLQAFLALSLAFGINGVVTNTVKLIVGRPRPDFFYRCFPDGKGDLQLPCSGKNEDIIEGLKSFPSGHSSFAFASMMFCALYMCGKLQVFNQRGRGQSCRLVLALSPLLAAVFIALSRTCDYHHHWQGKICFSCQIF